MRTKSFVARLTLGLEFALKDLDGQVVLALGPNVIIHSVIDTRYEGDKTKGESGVMARVVICD